MKMDTDVTIENIKKEIGWDDGQPGTSGMDTNSDEHRRIGSITVDSDDSNDESQIDIPFKDQTEIKQEVSYECENPSQEVELVWNKTICEQTNLKLEESQCFTDQNVSQYDDNIKVPISDVTDEPVIHVICPENESNLIFENKNNLETTRNTSSAEFRHGSSVCIKKFVTQNDLTSHKFGHICGKRFNTKESLEQHRKYCHMFHCPDCHKIFQLNFNQKAFKFECPACGLSLLRHQKTKRVHVDSETFYCPVTNCSKTFKKKMYLAKHMKVVHVKHGTFHCPENDCSKTFKNKIYLAHHMKIVHVKHGKFHCPETDCSKTFKNKICLAQHIKIVHCHIEPSYKCTECNKVFKTKSNLKSHTTRMSVHKTEASYMCTVEGCEKMFKTEKSRKQHVRKFHSE